MAAPAALPASKITLGIDGHDEVFTILGTLGGSTHPRLVSRDRDNVKFVLKLSVRSKGAHAANEYLTFKLYKAAGCRVPEVYLVKDKASNTYGLLEDFIDGVTLEELIYEGDPRQVNDVTFPAIRRDLVMHALFSNWDINETPNIMIPYTKERAYDYANPITIDCGGTLQFRAMGGIKNYTHEMTNIHSIIGYSHYEKPMGALKYVTIPELKKVICERWGPEPKSKDAILAAFDAVRPIIEPIFNDEEIKGLGLDLGKVRKALEARMEYLSAYCKPSAGGGTRRRRLRKAKTRKHYNK
jgi:hypothetical protein